MAESSRVQRLIKTIVCDFGISPAQMSSSLCVSDSSIRRWLRHDECHISPQNYQKVLSFYCWLILNKNLRSCYVK